jgi:hypothetical protein
MVYVCMREHNGIDRFGRTGKPQILLATLAAMPLKESAVEKNRLTVDAKNMTGARDFTSSAGEFELDV